MVHLYNITSTSSQIQEVTATFSDCRKIDISNKDTVEDADVYLVEIESTQKDILLHVRKLLIDKKDSLIYFFIHDSQSLILFQLTSLLNISNTFTPKNDTLKIISNIKKDISKNEDIKLELSIAKSMKDDISFMIFDTAELIYASPKLFDEFKHDNLDDVKSKLCSRFDLNHFLQNNSSMHESFALIRSTTSKTSGKKIIYLDSFVKNNSTTSDKLNSLDFIKNRIFFIETLKDKVLKRSISKTDLGIITLQVENMSNLKKDWNEYEIEMAIGKLLFEVAKELDRDTLLAQYDDSLYLSLFENLDFEKLKEKALTIQNNLINFTSKQTIKPILGLYAFNINDIELNKILSTTSDISNEILSHKDIKTKKLFRVTNVADDLDDARVIDIYLQTAFTNKTPIKLLNIYKGLCINTPSFIIKKSEENVHISFEQLQGTAISFEKTTVLQSSNFSKDIIADVAYMDHQNKISHLTNFRFVDGSANARKYGRVTCSQRTPISITHDQGTINGEILDISMNSIAIKTRIYKNVENIKLSKITLNFTLPISQSEYGYIKLTISAKVIFNLCDDKYCKIVVSLYNDHTNESILMEYIFSRQKEIIVELKKQTTMLI